MGYIVDNLLTENENALFEVHRTWLHLLPKIIPIYLVILALGVGGLIMPIIELTSTQSIILTIIIVVLLGVVTFISRVIHHSEEYVVTESRVIVKEGIIENEIYEISKDNIESIDIDQGVSGRLFNYGTLELNGTGNEDKRIKNIAKPIEFKKAIR